MSTVGINGVSAVYSTQTDHGIASLSWRTGSRGFVLKASPTCSSDVPPSIDTMLPFARGLVDHSPTAIAIPVVSISDTDPAITSWTLLEITADDQTVEQLARTVTVQSDVT